MDSNDIDIVILSETWSQDNIIVKQLMLANNAIEPAKKIAILLSSMDSSLL